MDLSAFHFIRPAWLILLLPVAAIAFNLNSRQSPDAMWRGIIAPRLLKVLILDGGEQAGKWRPTLLVTLGLLVSVVAIAGPSWQKQPTPFAQDSSSVFVVLKVTPAMLATDIQPSRLKRSVQKVHDLLQLRSDSRFGLIAYAGSAHLAMPLTTDGAVIEAFSQALEPGIMPVPGNDPLSAIRLASNRIAAAGTAGSIVLLADSVGAEWIDGFKQYRNEGGVPVHILGMAGQADAIPAAGGPPAPPLNPDLMKSAADALGGSFTAVSADDADVRRLAKLAESEVSDAAAQEGEQWQDMGYYLLPILALLMLSFFRRGGAVEWYR